MKALLVFGAVLVTSGGVACDPVADFQGAADSLVDPDETRLSTEPIEILRGHFSKVSVSGSAKDGGVLVALEHQEDETHLRIARFVLPTGKTALEDAELESCDAGVTTSYLESHWFEPGTTVLAFHDPDGDGAGTLRFVGPDCVDRREPIEDFVFTSWESITEFIDEEYLITGYVLGTSGGGVRFVDAETLKVKVLSEKTLGYIVSLTSVLLEEDGRIVSRQAGTWEEIESFGRGVTELVTMPSVLFGGTPTVVFRDEVGLRVWSREGVEMVAEDGCGAKFGSLMFSYFAPCEGGTLHVHATLGSPKFGAELPDVREEMQDGDSNSSAFLVVVGDDEPGAPGTLYGVEFEPSDGTTAPTQTDAIVEKKGENAVLDWPSYILNWTEAGGTYVESGESKRTLAGITDTFVSGNRWFALSNYRDGLVDLADIENLDELETEPLLNAVAWNVEGIPPSVWGDRVFWNLWDEEYESAYVIANVKKGAGEIHRFHWNDDSELLLSPPLVKDALVGSAVGLRRPAAVAYLKSGGRGELWVHLLEAGFEQPIAERVSEYSPLEWPSPGLLYVVDSGRDAGIWFAKAR